MGTDVNAVEGAIRNPNNYNHYMVLKPVERLVRVFHDNVLIAQTKQALRAIEIGKIAFEPVLYIPAGDLIVDLVKTEKTSHCPLKGHAEYYSINDEEISWAYTKPYEFAKALKERHAFWPGKVRIEEGE